jgi:predicted ArsR family transcriptional regulator
MTEPAPIEVHKALADDTRYRLYRFLRLSGRSVSVRELSTRLSLHPNTLRPHLRRLEEAGLVASEARKASAVGRPQVLYSATDREAREGRDFRLLADILAGLTTAQRQRDRAADLARDWGAYLVGRSVQKPGARRPAGPDLAVLQEALSDAGFDPRFRRRGARSVEITLRECPFQDLLDEHRPLVCAVHRGLLEGMLAASRPPLAMAEFDERADRSTACRLVARREIAEMG